MEFISLHLEKLKMIIQYQSLKKQFSSSVMKVEIENHLKLLEIVKKMDRGKDKILFKKIKPKK